MCDSRMFGINHPAAVEALENIVERNGLRIAKAQLIL